MVTSLDSPSRLPSAQHDDPAVFAVSDQIGASPRGTDGAASAPSALSSPDDRMVVNPPSVAASDQPPPRTAAEALEAIRKAVLEPDVERIDRRLADLERRLERNLADLNKKIGDSFAAFEKFVRQELQGNVSLMEAEVAEAERRRLVVLEKVDGVAREAEARTARMEKDLEEHDVATRREITRKGKELTETVERASLELRRLVEETVGKLDGSKVDRIQIGELLREMGERMHEGKAKGRSGDPGSPY